MVTYEIQGPDGKTYEIDGPEGASKEQIVSAIQAKLGAVNKQEEPESGGVAGFKSSLENLQADWSAAKAAMGVEGAEEEAKQHRARAAAIYKQPEFLEHPVDYLTGLAGQSAPYMLAPLIAGGAGALGAGALGAGAIGTAVAGTGSAFLANAGQFTTSNLSRQLEEGKSAKDLEVGKAIAAAIPQAALDTLSLEMMPGLGQILGRAGIKVGERELEEIAKQSIIKRTVMTSGTEGLTESAQQVLERAQAGLDLTDENARKEYFDNFIGGALLGGVIGAPGHAYEKMKAVDELKAKEYEAEQASKKAAEDAAKISQTAVPDAQGNVPAPTPTEGNAPLPTFYSGDHPLQTGVSNAADVIQNNPAPEIVNTNTAPIEAGIANDVIERAYAENGVSTAKVQKALKPQLEAMGLDTPAKQKEFLKQKQAELGIPTVDPKSSGMDKKKQTQAKTQWASNYQVRQEVQKGESNVAQSTGANVTGNQPSVTSPAPAVGTPAGGTTTPVAARVDTTGGTTKSTPAATEVLQPTLEGTSDVTQTTEAVKAEEKGQEQAAAPAIDPEAVRTAYTERVKSFEGSGFSFPSWDELSEGERAALAEEVQAENATKGMLPSKRERQKSSFLSPAMASIIKSRIDKKIASGEIDLKAIPQGVIDTYNENYKSQEGRLPKWESLNDDQRAIYLSFIRRNTAREQDVAFNQLRNYRKSAEKLTEKGSEEGAVAEGASVYELNRQAYSAQLPKWADLDSEAQQKFLNAIKSGLNNVNEEGKVERKVTQEEMDTGFADVYIHNAEKETKETAPAKEREQRNEKTREEKQRQESEQVDTGHRLPKSVILQLFKGDIKGVLQYLSQNAKGMAYTVAKITGKRLDEKTNNFRAGQAAISQGVFRQLSKVLGTISYDTKVVMEESNAVVKQLRREGKLAAYDPKTDTLYFTNDGLDEQTVLHEITHAGTVKILYKYKTDPSSLTQEQREAAEHIEKIFEFAKSRLGGRHKFAFENVYEFVSYAMTDVSLQRDLANIQARSLGKYTTDNKPFLRSVLSRFGSLWGQFTQALMKMYGLTKAGRTFVPAENIPDDIVKGFNELQQDELTSGKKGVIYQRPASERVSKEAIARGSAQAGYEANLLIEMSEAFGRILTAPEAGIDLEALPAKKQAKPPILAPAGGSTNYNELRDSVPSAKFDAKKVAKSLTVSRAGEIATRLLQNDRVAIKNWQQKLWLTGRLVAYTTGFNNVYDQITLSSGNAHWLYAEHIQSHNEAIRKATTEYAKARNLDIDTALKELGLFAMANHEEERRNVLYLMEVPLSDVKLLPDANGKKNQFSPTEARAAILDYLTSNKVNEAGAKHLRAQLEAIVNDKKNLDTSVDKDLLSKNSQKYSVAGYTPEQIKVAKAEYEKNKEAADKVLGKLKSLTDATISLNKTSNYLSEYANNFILFYGFENYVPYKGKHANDDRVEMFNINGRKIGGELQEATHAMGGRLTVPDNPILQVMADGAQAAMRAGRKDVTQAIYNAVKDETLDGDILQVVDFKDRHNENLLNELRGSTKVFHYMPDGKVAVIQINNKEQLEAIRRSYRDTNPALDSLLNVMNNATGTVGQFHTRYKLSFAPVNFVRDVLTNAWTIGAQLGPKESFRYIGAIAADMAKGNTFRTWKFASMYSKGDIKGIENLAKSNSYYKDLMDYVKAGGRVSYIAGIAPKGQLQELMRAPDGKLVSKKDIDKFFDIWVDGFELSARVSAFRVAKANEIAILNKKGGKTKEEIEQAAITTAAAYTKNLANFEQIGEWGRALGGLFMFFRPSATGAVRAIDAVAPAFRSKQAVKQSLPEFARAAIIKDKLSKEVTAGEKKKLEAELATMEKALETFDENYTQLQRSSRIVTGALIGAGIATYMLARGSADDDELGRNRVATDDMARWTKFARFHIPGFSNPIQLPWGYGLGSFAAMGAQIAAMSDFKNPVSVADSLDNIKSVVLDSFLPLPMSRISATEKPLEFTLDSIMPSLGRPLFEYAMNVDALGHQIYNNRQSRYGDAYTGGDNIPESFKAAARYLANATDGALDWSPNTLYFFFNNYIDGVSTLANGPINTAMWLSGKKDFNAHTDTMVLDSFFGTRSNVDARQWSKVEEDLKSRAAKVNMFKDDPEQYTKYMVSHPFDQMLAKMYNDDVNGHLKNLRAEANKWRTMRGLDMKTRTELVKNAVLQENFEKYRLVQLYSAFGVKP